MSVKFTDQLNEEAKTLDEYIFDYFNNCYPDEMGELIKSWDAKQSTDQLGGSGE